MKHSLDVLIRERVQAFVDELSELIRRSALESVQGVLGGNGQPAASSRPTSRRRRGKRVRRSPEQLERLQKRLLAAITAKPGQRKEDVAAAIGASTKDLQLVTDKPLASARSVSGRRAPGAPTSKTARESRSLRAGRTGVGEWSP